MIKYNLKRVIDCFDWDDLVIETYGKPYCFQQQDGCQPRGNVNIEISTEELEDDMPDSIPEVVNGEKMGVSFKSWLARDPKEWNGNKKDESFSSMWWDRNFYPDLQIIANDMCRKGLIEPGVYTINIDW